MTYDEWKDMQERGMNLRRNFSITESSKTRNGIFEDERWKAKGWEAEAERESHGWEGPNPVEVGSQRSARSSSHRTAESDHSKRSGQRSIHTGSYFSRHLEEERGSRVASQTASVRDWETMGEGEAGIPQYDGAMSEREMLQGYIDRRAPSGQAEESLMSSERYYKRKAGNPPFNSLA